MKKYVLNTDTGKLHIYGYCTYSNGKGDNYKYFDSEQEAYEFAGKHINPCKNCEKMKERILKGEK